MFQCQRLLIVLVQPLSKTYPYNFPKVLIVVTFIPIMQINSFKKKIYFDRYKVVEHPFNVLDLALPFCTSHSRYTNHTLPFTADLYLYTAQPTNYRTARGRA